jgi:hypothetical protein
MTEAEAIEYQKYLSFKCAELMEHFDTVQIIVTKHDRKDNTTDMLSNGSGNLYARLASVDDWLSRNE